MDDRPDSQNVISGIAPVSFLLKRAAQYSADLFADMLGKTGLTQRQFTVMETVLSNQGASQTELVRITGIDRSTLADLVNRLETQGYIRRERSNTDARVNFVFLTEQGLSTVSSAQPIAMQVDEAMLQVLPEDNRRQFVKSLEQLSGKLDAED